MKKYNLKLKKLKDWITQNKTETLLLIIILAAAVFFRLWRIDEYLPFLGDEGRDVRIVRRFLTGFDLMFIGPRTSIGDMYLGPLYYYLISPFLWIFSFSPVGPAVFVALLGTATVGLVWLVSREWFGKTAAATAALLYAISPVVTSFSRHSWNPNIMPFFSLLCVYSIWRIWKRNQWWWLVVLGTSFAFVLQSHYLGLLLLPTIGIFWLATLSQVISKKQNAKRFLVFSLFSFSLFTFLMSPLFIFDAKHGWHNLGAMTKFFTDRQATVSAKPWSAIPNTWPLWQDNLVGELLIAKNKGIGNISALALALTSIIFLVNVFRAKDYLSPVLLLFTWISVGLLGLGSYKQAIYTHYFGFLFTAPFLFTGLVLQRLWDRKLEWLVIGIVIGTVWINLQTNPLKYPPQRQMQRVEEVDRKIISESGGKSFNFALIAKRNYEEGYLYFFELWNAPVREIDAQRSGETITGQLFVVCEDTAKPGEPDPCNPINHPKAEIANFGWARVDKEWEVGGVRLFKLLHTQ